MELNYAAAQAAFDRRNGGMSPQVQAELDAKDDWWGICPRCKARVSGTPAQLKRHRCDS